ncbi:putative ABC transport system ATP-binding protein [Stackebrandtia endophytica]|uniref:Putative ABC transport system ATP-binding protein n=1 Tax=Stackebrandtia endophytica TaxID=1496996 RepID=A0A543AVE9_9ACTN|nr:ATP-binding cassette domain-containing protein [Stackebrandtia endophytica]TQL76556.1 putative ABC transport system ATP-binding protein [Stackebrandtia endophytica]
MTVTIEVVDVHKTHGGIGTPPALRGVDIEFLPGELTVLAGPSGSGKTTLLSIMGGHDHVDSGSVSFGDSLSGVTAPELNWRRMGYLPQALVLLDELTIAQNVQLPVQLSREPLPEHLADEKNTRVWLERLELSHLADRFPAQTSGGEQQRTALARALRLEPAVLLADEPTGQLDAGRVGIVLDVLIEYARTGATVVITSHDPTVIAVADTVITMADGEVVSQRRQRRR